MASLKSAKHGMLRRLIMTKNKVIGYTEFFGKVNAIVVRNGEVGLQETKIKRTDCCWKD